MKKGRLVYFSIFLSVSLLGFDNLARSFPPENIHTLDEEISLIWNSNNLMGKEIFLERTEKRLPKYKVLFKEAGQNLNINWKLLAAISYQESHWNPNAVSKSGVKGLMMLTEETSKEVGVNQRTDPRQSIVGGAIYLKKIYERLPNSITGSDRTWLSLAAYNIGYSHVLDAIKVTELLGHDHNSWEDIRNTLLLLSREEYYNFTKFGYIPGEEVRNYVQNVRVFYETLVVKESI